MVLFKCFESGTELAGAVRGYLADRTMVTDTYGPVIGDWCVDKVTNFSKVFASTNFNERLDGWNTSSALDMSSMFENCPFNHPLAHFVVDKVLSFDSMFLGSSFNQTLSTWSIRSALNMNAMFAKASSFNQDLCTWGLNLNAEVNTSKMFVGTSCPDQTDPDTTARPPGPFCKHCHSLSSELASSIPIPRRMGVMELLNKSAIYVIEVESSPMSSNLTEELLPRERNLSLPIFGQFDGPYAFYLPGATLPSSGRRKLVKIPTCPSRCSQTRTRQCIIMGCAQGPGTHRIRQLLTANVTLSEVEAAMDESLVPLEQEYNISLEITLMDLNLFWKSESNAPTSIPSSTNLLVTSCPALPTISLTTPPNPSPVTEPPTPSTYPTPFPINVLNLSSTYVIEIDSSAISSSLAEALLPLERLLSLPVLKKYFGTFVFSLPCEKIAATVGINSTNILNRRLIKIPTCPSTCSQTTTQQCIIMGCATGPGTHRLRRLLGSNNQGRISLQQVETEMSNALLELELLCDVSLGIKLSDLASYGRSSDESLPPTSCPTAAPSPTTGSLGPVASPSQGNEINHQLVHKCLKQAKKSCPCAKKSKLTHCAKKSINNCKFTAGIQGDKEKETVHNSFRKSMKKCKSKTKLLRN